MIPKLPSLGIQGVFCIVGFIMAMLLPCFAQDTPKFEGTSIPVPPEQVQPWTPPPAKLPPVVVSAITELFDAGLSDPRGCEYLEIVVQNKEQAEGKNADETLKTHGWVLPPQPNQTSRYAICWNGLTYPVASVGAPADLDMDIGKLLGEKSTASSHDPTRPSQTESLAYDELTLIKVPLLLRLGKVQPAEKLWQKWSVLAQFSINDGNRQEREHFDPFTILSREWLWAHYNRAMQAHLRGDAKLAFAFVQVIPDLRAKVEQLALKRGVTLAKVPAFYRQPDQSLDLTFLNQVPALLEDDKRRVEENVTNRDEENNPDKITDKKQRIALLIRDLEDVEAYPMTCPGYIQFDMNVVVQALVRQGEDAVDPLIDCLEQDHRLTRTIDDGGGRHFQAYGYSRVVGVEEPAFYALQGILKARDQFSWPQEPYVNATPGGPKLERTALAAQIRAYWNKNRTKTLPQRWYDMLADDKAQPDAKAKELAELQQALTDRNEKLAAAQQAQADLIRKQRELDDAKREMELIIEKRVQESLTTVRDKARLEAQEGLGLKLMEKEETISAMGHQIEELRRKAEQGSQQLQGEAQELELESILRAKFPRDTIEPVPKGEFGGDILHRVVSNTGQICGTILWEAKRTKKWSDGWLSKLRDDQRTAKAEIAVIVSQVLPKGVETFDLVELIWVTQPRYVIPIAITLHQSLIEIAAARIAGEGMQTKKDLIYKYLTGTRFRQRIEPIVEKFTDMQVDLDRERKTMTRLWAKREAQIRAVNDSTSWMWGDLQGIAGRAVLEIEGLEIKLLSERPVR